MGRKKQTEYYALYKGDEFMAVGTADEIAEQMGMRAISVICLASPKRSKARSAKGGTFAIKVNSKEEAAWSWTDWISSRWGFSF